MKRYIGKFSKQKVLVVGDLIVDRFVRGKVSRISPEAPVPVIEVTSETYAPGGAGNVASNLRALSAHVWVSGVAGKDSTGQKLIEDFKDSGVHVEGIVMDGDRPTSLKTRVIAEHQQVVRFDREVKRTLSKQEELRALKFFERIIPDCQVVILSDYGKGMLTANLVAGIIHESQKNGILVTVDPKPENFFSYKRVDAITPNLAEAWAGMQLHPKDKNDEGDLEKLGGQILSALQCRCVLITRGKEGMSLFRRGQSGRGYPPAQRINDLSKARVIHIPTIAKEIFDVTGAGDTVIATFSLALAAGADFVSAAKLANAAAGVVVGKLGTATCSLEELKKSLL